MSVPTAEPPQGQIVEDVRPDSILLHRSLVHKRASAEVLVGRPRREGSELGFTVELPQAHWTMGIGSDRVPPILILEAVRQLGLATAHYGLSTPQGWRFIAHSMALEWLTTPVRFPQYGPLEMQAIVRPVDVSTRKGQVAGLTAEARLEHEGREVAVASGRMSFLPVNTYRAVRRNARRTTSRGTRTDTDALRDIHVDGRELRAEVGWDWRDRFHFDHDSDHVPGMVLAASACRAQHVLTDGNEPSLIDIEFARYAELDRPVHVVATTDQASARPVCVTFMQDEHLVARARIEGALGGSVPSG